MKWPCMQKGCDRFALHNSAYCQYHQSRQEIQDRHGPIIEEQAKGGIMGRAMAQADEVDDLAIAEDFQNEAKRLEALKESEQMAKKAKPQVHQSAYERTKAELENAVHVPLMVTEAEVFRINDVPWVLIEGINSVPWQIKEAYEDHQKMLRENTLVQNLMKVTGDEAKPFAYYEEVMGQGYRGEVQDRHDKLSRR